MIAVPPFPILFRVWFALLGTFFLLFAWLNKGEFYWRRTDDVAPKWLARLSLTTMGLVFILVALFARRAH